VVRTTGGAAPGHEYGPTSALAENEAQTAQTPDGHRYAADCTWTDAPADVLAPLLGRMWSVLDGPSYSIWYGLGTAAGADRRAGHGGRSDCPAAGLVPRVPPRAPRGPRDLRDLAVVDLRAPLTGGYPSPR
jgi:hypothetical protein